MSQIEVGELLYEYTLKITGLTEYGTGLAELLSGKLAMPPEGARFDVYFAGQATGDKLKGTVRGVDYLRVRPDGRMELDIHAEISTEDGAKISLKADGICNPRKDSSISDLKENITLFSSYKKYTWMNTLQVWGIGTVDLATQIINVKGYAA
jgi:hypothetical protein